MEKTAFSQLMAQRKRRYDVTNNAARNTYKRGYFLRTRKEKRKKHAEACLFMVGEAGLEPARPQ